MPSIIRAVEGAGLAQWEHFPANGHRLRQAQLAGAQCGCMLDNTGGSEALGKALMLAKSTAESFIATGRRQP